MRSEGAGEEEERVVVVVVVVANSRKRHNKRAPTVNARRGRRREGKRLLLLLLPPLHLGGALRIRIQTLTHTQLCRFLVPFSSFFLFFSLFCGSLKKKREENEATGYIKNKKRSERRFVSFCCSAFVFRPVREDRERNRSPELKKHRRCYEVSSRSRLSPL